MSAHLDDALSALLDDELGPAQRRLAERHLGGCASCRDELRRVQEARAAVRSLPPVEPPAGAVDRVIAATARSSASGDREGVVVPLAAGRRRAGGLLAASVAATLALVVLGPGLGRPEGEVAPVQQLMAGHRAALQVLDGGGDGGGEHGWREVAPSEVPPPYPVPLTLDGGYRLVAAFDTAHGLHLVYRDGAREVSLVEVPGRVDRAELPAGARRGPDGRSWHVDVGAWGVVVVQRDGLVQVLVGDDPPEQLVRAATAAPDPRPMSLWQRVRHTCQRVLADFAVLED